MGGEEKLSREALPLLKKLCFVQHLAGKENLASGQTCPTPGFHSYFTSTPLLPQTWTSLLLLLTEAGVGSGHCDCIASHCAAYRFNGFRPSGCALLLWFLNLEWQMLTTCKLQCASIFSLVPPRKSRRYMIVLSPSYGWRYRGSETLTCPRAITRFEPRSDSLEGLHCRWWGLPS